MTTLPEYAAALRAHMHIVREFVEDELDNREFSGGDETDYVRDAAAGNRAWAPSYEPSPEPEPEP
jgi:hypothetical protein